MTHPDSQRLLSLLNTLAEAAEDGTLSAADSSFGKRAIIDRLVGAAPTVSAGSPLSAPAAWWVCSSADPTPRPWKPGDPTPKAASFWKPGLVGWQKQTPGAEGSSSGAAWETFRVGGERFRLRRVDAWTYTVGSRDDDGDAYDDEKPRHSVRFTRSYGVGEFAVTQGLYASVMGKNPSVCSDEPDSARRPVEEVSWFDAVRFCNRLSELLELRPAYRISGEDVRCDFSAPGFRLPTEHEWEVAARAGADFLYSGSDDLYRVGCFDDNSCGDTYPVGQQAPNGWGLYDLSGNVWEWCWDWYDSSAYQSGTMVDPVGPQSGASRVNRGGSWEDSPRDARVAVRNRRTPGDGYGTGLRLVRTLP